MAVDLSLADDIAGLAGETVTVPLFVQVSAGESAKSFSGFDFVVEYDPAVLTFNSAAATSFTSGFTLTPNTSIGSGLLAVSGYTAGATSPIDSTSGSQPLANLSFTINATASLGSTAVNLRPSTSSGDVLTSLFDADANELILDPAPTNVATDMVDGTVTILAITAPVFTGLLTTQGVTRVSVDASGTEGNGTSEYPAIFSPDGTKVAFYSSATNLVPNDTNGTGDIFLKDLVTGAISRLSVNASGVEGDGESSMPAFSPDGTKIAFSSSATNLAPNDTNGTNIFLKDLATGAISRLSVDTSGADSDGWSGQPVFSPDGTKIAFSSSATNLVPNDTNGTQDIFLKDLATGAITRVSVDPSGTEGNNDSSDPVFSPDGSRVAFASGSSNLVSNDTNDTRDIFLKDLVTGAISRLSVDTSGAEGDGWSGQPVFSPDGTKIAFSSSATNLVSNDTNKTSDIFVRDLVTGEITRASVDASGAQANAFYSIVGENSYALGSSEPVFSPDGTKVAFMSWCSNLVPNDTNNITDIFVKDLMTGGITRASVDASGAQVHDGEHLNEGSFSPTFSSDGTKLAFYSFATDVVPNDTNDRLDVFVAFLGFTFSVPNGTSAIATLDAVNPSDSDATLTYTLSGTDSAAFTINPSTGALTFTSPPSYAAPVDADSDNIYDILVNVTDGTSTTTAPARITVSAESIVESEGNVVLSKRDGVGLYANGMPITYDTDGADGTPPTQLTKYFGLWDAIEAERLPGFAGDENTLFFKNAEGTVYRVPADDTWRLYGADRVRNAFSIPLLDPSASPLSSAATTPVEVTGHVQLRQTFAGELVADGLRLIRNDLPVSRRTEIAGTAAVYVAVAVEFDELDSNSLSLLWWNGVDSLREWRFTRDTNAWLFASESLISAEDADLAFGVSLQNIVIPT